jgi:hypothetical protein
MKHMTSFLRLALIIMQSILSATAMRPWEKCQRKSATQFQRASGFCSS